MPEIPPDGTPIPTCTLGGVEYQILPPLRKIEIVEVRDATARGERYRAALTALGLGARGLWKARGPRKEDGTQGDLLYEAPAYTGVPSTYGSQVYEALLSRCSEAEISNAAARAFLAWFDAAKLFPSQENIKAAEDFGDPPAQTPSTSGGA